MLSLRPGESPLFTLRFTREADGRIKVKGAGVPGLFLASKDWDALCRDLNVVVRDLLHHNRGIDI